MRLSTYIMLMFSLTAILYMMGNQPTGFSILSAFQNQHGSSMTWDTALIQVIFGVTNPSQSFNNVIADVALIAAAVSLVTGFAAIYIIPAAIAIAIANWFIFPFSNIIQPCQFVIDPAVINVSTTVGGITQTTTMCSGGMDFGMPIIIIFNILLVMSILSFIRGGDA